MMINNLLCFRDRQQPAVSTQYASSRPRPLCFKAFLDAGYNLVVLKKFSSCCLRQSLLNLPDEPSVIIQKPVNGLLNQVRCVLTSAGGKLLKQRFFFRG